LAKRVSKLEDSMALIDEEHNARNRNGLGTARSSRSNSSGLTNGNGLTNSTCTVRKSKVQ
jgi:hypothetical protein